MCKCCVYCGEEFSNNEPILWSGGEALHHDCYDRCMEELCETQPIEWTDSEAYQYDDDWAYQFDDDPNPYHGDYSEM